MRFSLVVVCCMLGLLWAFHGIALAQAVPAVEVTVDPPAEVVKNPTPDQPAPVPPAPTQPPTPDQPAPAPPTLTPPPTPDPPKTPVTVPPSIPGEPEPTPVIPPAPVAVNVQPTPPAGNSDDFTVEVVTPKTPPGGKPDTTPGGPAVKPTVLSLADILKLASAGQLKQAENAYFAWSQYWDEESPATLAQIERGFLMKSYAKGSFPALTALIHARDTEAILMLKTLVLSGGDRLAKTEYAAAIRLLGECGDENLLNPLRMALYSDDKEIVYAAIEALGNLGDKRIIPELFTLLDSDNLERNVLVARTLSKLGAGKQLHAQFQPQLRFPMPGTRERAALMLAAAGFADGWSTLVPMMSAKEAPYYPLMLTVLNNLPSQESAKALRVALNGDEAEQLAALHGIGGMSETESDRTLLVMVRDNARTVNVRLACLDMLTKRNSPLVARDLWEMAVSREDVAQELKVGAMTSLPRYHLLKGDLVRDALYKLILQYDTIAAGPTEPDDKRILRETLASTARASLLLSLHQSALDMP